MMTPNVRDNRTGLVQAADLPEMIARPDDPVLHADGGVMPVEPDMAEAAGQSVVDRTMDVETAVAADQLMANGAAGPDSPMLEGKPAPVRPGFRPGMLAADLGWLLLVLFTFLIRQLLQEQPILVERAMSGTLFQVLSRPIALATSLVPFSITELLLLGGFAAGLGWLLWAAFRVVRRLFGRAPAAVPRRRGIIRRRARALMWGGATLAMLFFLLHGVNYFRLPVEKNFAFSVRPRSVEELSSVAQTLAREASAVRALCLEDERGVLKLRDGVRATLDQTSAGFMAASADWPQLAGPSVRPKAVLISGLWSYTGISGMYVPFFVEANVNVDQPDYLIPDTAAHEVAHTRGFAREDEAGFISFLANTHNPNPDIRYSALANAYVRVANALYAQDPLAYSRAARLVSEGMSRDLAENARYWNQFAGPVAEASEQINHSFLKSNKQVDGVRSYGRMVDLVLAYWEKNGGHF